VLENSDNKRSQTFLLL